MKQNYLVGCNIENLKDVCISDIDCLDLVNRNCAALFATVSKMHFHQQIACFK
jgi:hypothetical protein